MGCGLLSESHTALSKCGSVWGYFRKDFRNQQHNVWTFLYYVCSIREDLKIFTKLLSSFMLTRFLQTLIGAVPRQALGGFASQFVLDGVRESGFGMVSRMQWAIAHWVYRPNPVERPSDYRVSDSWLSCDLASDDWFSNGRHGVASGFSFKPGVASGFSIQGYFASLSTYPYALLSNGTHAAETLSIAIEMVGRCLTINDFVQLKSGRDRACPTSP